MKNLSYCTSRHFLMQLEQFMVFKDALLHEIQRNGESHVYESIQQFRDSMSFPPSLLTSRVHLMSVHGVPCSA